MKSPTNRYDQSQLSTLNRRELYLWGFCGVVVVIMFLGIATSVVPDILHSGAGTIAGALNLPQLMIAFICLLVLFGLHVVGQRRDLVQARDALYRRLIMEEAKVEGLLDHETQTYSPLLIESMLERLAQEATPAQPLVLFEVGVRNAKIIERRNGEAAVAHLGRALTEILRNSLRGSDRICREAQGNFLVLLPNTSPELASIPLNRITQAVEKWNEVTSGLDYRLEISVCQASTTGDTEPAILLEQVRRERKETESLMNFANLLRLRPRIKAPVETFPGAQLASQMNRRAADSHVSH